MEEKRFIVKFSGGGERDRYLENTGPSGTNFGFHESKARRYSRATASAYADAFADGLIVKLLPGVVVIVVEVDA